MSPARSIYEGPMLAAGGRLTAEKQPSLPGPARPWVKSAHPSTARQLVSRPRRFRPLAKVRRNRKGLLILRLTTQQAFSNIAVDFCGAKWIRFLASGHTHRED